MPDNQRFGTIARIIYEDSFGAHSFLGTVVAAALAAEAGANMIGPPIRRREPPPWRYSRPVIRDEDPITKRVHKAQRVARKARRKGEAKP